MSITHVKRAATTPPITGPLDHQAFAQSLLADARITLAGTQVVWDFHGVRKLRADVASSERSLRTAAAGGVFPAELTSGAAQAHRAVQLLGRLWVLYANMSDGEPTAADWKRFDPVAARLVRAARAALDQAYLAAYTGTHP
ncbi:MAG: hypothetical protein JWM98_2946 [Thermoleophilia bacterium]|nr:hypothetical protein [Thermoleophilia bacterium]